MKEALLYEPVEGGKVLCTACARYCRIGEGQIGLCGIRQNLNGKLQLLVYGKVISGHVDPIEKKPVTHFMPGAKVFSIATTGCNWLCHPAGAEILLPNGGTKKVEHIAPGDSVWSYDLEGGIDPQPSVVTHVGARTARIWEVRYGAEPPERILLTEEHPVWTKKGWKTVGDLILGDWVLKIWPKTSDGIAESLVPELDDQLLAGTESAYLAEHPRELALLVEAREAGCQMANNREWCRVTSIKPTDRVETVYSLETFPTHNYVADGIVVHNCQYCIPGESVISTDHGMIPASDLWSLGINPRTTTNGEVVDLEDIRVWTHKGRLRKAGQIHRHFYSDSLLEINPVYLAPLRCTPDHRVFAAAGGSGRIRKVRAKELEAGDFVAIPKTVPGSEKVTIDVLDFLSSLPQPRYKRNIQLVEEEGIVRYNFGRARGVPRIIPLDEDFARLLGYYAAEGSFARASGRANSCSAWFSFGSSERERQDEVTRIVKRLTGYAPTRNEQRNRTALVVSNTPLALLLRGLGGEGARRKRVPDVLLSSNDPGPVRAFLTGYLNGDGYLTETRMGTILGSTSASEILTRGVVELFLKLGTVPRYYVGRNPSTSVIEGRTVSRSNDYMARVLVESIEMQPEAIEWAPRSPRAIETPDYFLLPIRTIKTLSHVGYVYNLAVASDHSYIADFIAVANCQNYDISQRRKIQGTDISPQGVVDLTVQQGAQGIAYTYNQPTIFMEFAHDIGVLAREAGLINIFVSNGYDTPQTVAMMPDFLDAITVDFKGNGEPRFVRRYIGVPDPQPIFDSLIEMRDKTDVHIEITDLVVPEVGDDLEYAQKLARFVYEELGPDTPIHFLRFHPDYKMVDLPLTPVETLEKHHQVAQEVGLKYVYIGNVPGHRLEHTYCPGCGRIAIQRHGFDIQSWGLDAKNRCKECGYQLPIVGDLQPTWREFRFQPVM